MGSMQTTEKTQVLRSRRTGEKGKGVPFSLYEVGSAPREGMFQLHPRGTTLEHTYALLPPTPLKPRKKQVW